MPYPMHLQALNKCVVSLGLVQQKLVKANVILCFLTYVGVIVTILAHCRPIHKNWQVNPDPGGKFHPS